MWAYKVTTPDPNNPPAGDNHEPFTPPSAEKPENYLVLSALATLLCCAPLGIIGIYHATKVDAAYLAGNYEEAVARASDARKWSILAFIVCAICLSLLVVVQIALLVIALVSSRGI